MGASTPLLDNAHEYAMWCDRQALVLGCSAPMLLCIVVTPSVYGRYSRHKLQKHEPDDRDASR